MAVSRSTCRLILLTIVVNVFGLLQYGYPMGVLNLSEVVIKSFINESFTDQFQYSPSKTQIVLFYGLANGGINFGAILGSFFSGNIANRFGRKFAVFFAPSISAIISAILFGISYAKNSFQILLLGRAVVGFGYAGAQISVPLYLNEFSPINQRGYFNGWHTTVSQSWLLISMVLSLPSAMGTSTLWPYLYSLPAIPGLVLLILTAIIPDTPPYVYVFQKNPEKAATLITIYHGVKTDMDMLFEGYDSITKALKSEMTISDIWRNKGVRKGFVVGAVLMAGNALTGQTYLNAFSTSMFVTAGFTNHVASYMSMVPAGILILASIVVPFASEKYGRRVLILSSIFLQFVGLSIYIVCASMTERTEVGIWVSDFSIVGVSIATVGYAIGIGPVTFLCISELVPILARATSIKYVSTVGATFALIISIVFPVANDGIGALCLIPLATVPQVAIFTFLYFKMPETKHKSEMEIFNQLLGSSGPADAIVTRQENYGATTDT